MTIGALVVLVLGCIAFGLFGVYMARHREDTPIKPKH
jgi:hypothetical protein